MSTSASEVGLSLKRLQVRHHRALDAALRPLGIGLVQWDALRHLDQNPDVSLRDLARLTFQSDQACGALAGRMVERGLIERIDGPGRAVRHRLTDRGMSVRRAGAETVETVLAESFAPLSPAELSTFDELLRLLLRLA